MKKLKKFKKIALALFILAIASGLYTWFFVYNKPHPNYEKLEAEYHYQTEKLFSEYRSDKALTDKKCTGKMISVSGKIDYVENQNGQTIVVFIIDQGVFGDEGIRCTMLEDFQTTALGVKPGTQVTVKGFCAGYNDTDVIIEKCTIEL